MNGSGWKSFQEHVRNKQGTLPPPVKRSHSDRTLFWLWKYCQDLSSRHNTGMFLPTDPNFLLSDLQTSPADIQNIISHNNHRDEMLSGVNRRSKTTQQVNVCVCVRLCACVFKQESNFFFQVWRRHADRLAHWNVLKSRRVSRGRSDWEKMSSEPQFCGQNALLTPEVRGEWPGWCEMTERQTQR